jgi:YesN/AraC family two-component response regulator
VIDSAAVIDLLFTDVIMPGAMNGRQLVTEALKRRPSLKTLYTSGYTENAIVHHGRLDVGVLLLVKPYRRFDLARMMRMALDN